MNEEKSGLPDEFLKIIGSVVVNFSYLEYIISIYCGHLLGAKIPGSGFIITSEMSMNNLMKLISVLFKNAFKNQEVQDGLKNLLSRIDECSKHRNLVAHSIWTPEFDFVKEVKGEVVRRVKFTAKRKKGLDLQWENYSLIDLNAIVNEIKKVAEDIKELMESVLFSLQFAETSDAGKEYPMEIEPFLNEHNGKTYYMPKQSDREKELTVKIEAYLKKQKEEFKKNME